MPLKDSVRTVLYGLKTGYRLIDTAAMYRTEVGVRRALGRSGIDRKDIFITTKLSNHGRDVALRSFERSLKRLGSEYVDLYLIHYPYPAQNQYVDTWRALIELKADGRARSIGVSNFNIEQLKRIIDATGVVPALNQIGLHPTLQQRALCRFHYERRIVTEAWSPLGAGASIREPAIRELAARHSRTPAQIVLRWHMQLGNVAIPKSTRPEHLEANFRIFDFELTEEDMHALASLDVREQAGTGSDALPQRSGVVGAIAQFAERYPVVDPIIQAAKKARPLVHKLRARA